MALLDLSNIKASGTKLEAVQPGEYLAHVAEAVVKDTRKGDGQFINMKLVLASGDFEGRSLYYRFNIKNPSKKAQEIGLGELKGFMECAGMDSSRLESVKDLVGKKVTVKTGVETMDGDKDIAVIKYFDRPLIIEKPEEV